MSQDDVVVRDAAMRDVAAMCRFGAAHVADHYRPLIGDAAARAQVAQWWTPERFSAAVEAGQAAVAERRGELVGVAERGTWDGEHVIWKLYVHPAHRGRGIGRRLLRALIGQLPAGTERIQVEHFAANERAGEFYAREGFTHVRTVPNESNPGAAVMWRELDLGRAGDGP